MVPKLCPGLLEHLLTLPESEGLAMRRGVQEENEVPLQLL